MTSAKKSLLVLDGHQIKARLIADRQTSGVPVHVDWFRFTVQRRNAPMPEANHLFPVDNGSVNVWGEDYRAGKLRRLLAEVPDCDFSASVQAFELAVEVSACLGSDYSVCLESKKGHDFYKYRWAIERNGTECGWVGYLASGESPRQQAQSSTIHCNLFGSACTFATEGWRDRLAQIVDDREGVVTRCDLALDFFDGLSGGLDGIVKEYQSGACDVGGKRLKSNCVGDWLNGCERSLYFGSKEAGKQTNCYEKGHQLFGVDSGSEWLRVEVRLGNKLRVLGTDLLRRPADFFAGCSDWHQSVLLRADCVVQGEKIPCIGRLPLETVEAECTRNLRWLVNTASATVALAVQSLGDADLWSLLEGAKLPGRLKKFSLAEIAQGMGKAANRVSAVVSCPTRGQPLTLGWSS